VSGERGREKRLEIAAGAGGRDDEDSPHVEATGRYSNLLGQLNAVLRGGSGAGEYQARRIHGNDARLKNAEGPSPKGLRRDAVMDEFLDGQP
jgi:hypothetical protein